MAGKAILIILVILLGIVIITPFVLNIVGIKVFELGSVGGAPRGEAVLMRSTNGGADWENVSLSGTKKIPFPGRILALAFHPRKPDVIFLGSKGSGLWKSSNGGAFWEKTIDASGVLDPRADVYDIGVSGSNPDIIYLAVFQKNRGRVLRSDDGGSSFREVYFVTADRFAVFDTFVNPVNPNNALIATGQGGLLETRDGGRTWRVVRWFTEAVERMIVNPLNPREIFVMTASDNLFKSVDAGANWASLDVRVREESGRQIDISVAPPSNPFAGFTSRDFIRALLLDPNDIFTLYAGTSEGLLRSSDGGFNWKRLAVLIPPEALPVTAVAVHPRSPLTIFAGAGAELHRSDDGGTNWSVQNLPTKSRVSSLSVSPLQPQLMFATFGR